MSLILERDGGSKNIRIFKKLVEFLKKKLKMRVPSKAL
jgi:hypothetical protein